MTRYKLSWIVCVVLASNLSNVNKFISPGNTDISPYCGPKTDKFGTRASGISVPEFRKMSLPLYMFATFF